MDACHCLRMRSRSASSQHFLRLRPQRKVLDQQFRIQHDRIRMRDVRQQLQQRVQARPGGGAPAERAGLQIPAARPQRWQVLVFVVEAPLQGSPRVLLASAALTRRLASPEACPFAHSALLLGPQQPRCCQSRSA